MQSIVLTGIDFPRRCILCGCTLYDDKQEIKIKLEIVKHFGII